MSILKTFKKEYEFISSEKKHEVFSSDLASLTPSEMLSEFNAFVVERTDTSITVAALEPRQPSLEVYLKRYFNNLTINWFRATKDDIREAMKLHNIDLLHEIELLLDSHFDNDSTIPKFVDYLIQYAFIRKASDIHIEPRRNEVTVRFRMDGILHKVLTFPIGKHVAVVSRFKILANLKTDESRRPQDGRIEPEGFAGSSLRVSIIPTLFGEKIVLRVLDESSAVLDPSALGFSKEQREIIERNIDKPFGMIVASGPTGSGKTTTLYALLQLLKKDEMNIATLEDPIEFALEKINQTQVHPSIHFSFPEGLRSLLRQDPDVILVGEIRDHETISMAANAAMTGHLVLTSLHTNDAPSAFARFLEMDVDDFMVASILNLVIAQRLVRKVCPHCETDRALDPVVIKKIKERRDILDVLETQKPGITDNLTKMRFKYGSGCDRCFGSGYHGRVGIYELLEMDKEIHDLVLSHASSDEIYTAAKKKGFESMVVDGIRKIFQGKTTFEEVLRTTRN